MRFYDPFNGWETFGLSRTATPIGEKQNVSVYTPYLDVLDREDEVVVTVDLPGIEKKDIQLNVVENNLVISADRKRGDATVKFQRILKLPANVDDSSAKATMNNGVLEVRLPKAAKKQNSIKID